MDKNNRDLERYRDAVKGGILDQKELDRVLDELDEHIIDKEDRIKADIMMAGESTINDMNILDVVIDTAMKAINEELDILIGASEFCLGVKEISTINRYGIEYLFNSMVEEKMEKELKELEMLYGRLSIPSSAKVNFHINLGDKNQEYNEKSLVTFEWENGKVKYTPSIGVKEHFMTFLSEIEHDASQNEVSFYKIDNRDVFDLTEVTKRMKNFVLEDNQLEKGTIDTVDFQSTMIQNEYSKLLKTIQKLGVTVNANFEIMSSDLFLPNTSYDKIISNKEIFQRYVPVILSAVEDLVTKSKYEAVVIHDIGLFLTDEDKELIYEVIDELNQNGLIDDRIACHDYNDTEQIFEIISVGEDTEDSEMLITPNNISEEVDEIE